jgi:hypothetical protein
MASPNVLAAFVVLIVLIIATPAIAFAEGTTTYGIVALMASIALGVVSVGVRQGEVDHLEKLVRPVLPLLALPVLWMLVQLCPMPFSAWSHPVWASAAESLSVPVFGHITVDVGATLIGLTQYLTASGILVVAAAVSVDRTRAEWLLFWLVGATALSAAVLIARISTGVFPATGPTAADALRSASALGTIFAAVAVVRSIERFETRRTRAGMTWTKFAGSLAGSLLAFAICALALMMAAPAPVTFAAGVGLATVALVVLIRRLVLGPYAIGALAVVTIVGAIAIAAASSTSGESDLTLRFATEASSMANSIAGRMITDNPRGIGVGTYHAMLPVYQSFDHVDGPEWPPTTASQVTIEMGRAALWVFVLMSVVATGLLLRGALGRGRDSFYAAGAAGCTVALAVEAFADATLFNMAIRRTKTARHPTRGGICRLPIRR